MILLSGVRTGFGKKVWKVRNAEPDGGCTRIVRESQKDMVYCRGVWGSSPRNFLDLRVANGVFQSFCGAIYPNTHTPTPQKISLQIYTDLKNGPGSWKKVWNQTKVWRFCPLYFTVKFGYMWTISLQNFNKIDPCFPRLLSIPRELVHPMSSGTPL